VSPPKWASCANCGGSYPGMTTETCSADCARQLADKRRSGRDTTAPKDTYPTAPDRRGTKSTAPKPKGLCSVVLLPPVAAAAAFAATLLRRRT
jgi:hypothetical protein